MIYDISSDEDRTRLANLLFDYGLQRVQYSAFKGELDSHDRTVLASDVQKFVSTERDSIYIIPLCDRCSRLCDIVASRKVVLIEKEKVKVF